MRTSTPPDSDPPPLPAPAAERNFLDHYFASVYNKLEADALLFNRELPHAGLMGSENENALAAVLRQFLPPKFGIEVNALVIDRFGRVSDQADIVIYDAENQATFLRKVYPVEIVYAVIEVKTSLSSSGAKDALENLASVSELEFRPALSNYWQTLTKERELHHYPPALYAFAFRTDCQSFETFAGWIDWQYLHRGAQLRDQAPKHPEIRLIRVCALDKGVIFMESTNGHVTRYATVADDAGATRSFPTTVRGRPERIDPAKALFIFLWRLWTDLQTHKLHPGFDIRTYVSTILGTVIEVPNI
ncbi:MAG TPA: DUF6602 domain-containing protein [Blastocatellia bacterium]|jgi:hypothetical protein|nr:DUF6602 domain-containing protein [Blastocatellia bacterium]